MWSTRRNFDFSTIIACIFIVAVCVSSSAPVEAMPPTTPQALSETDLVHAMKGLGDYWRSLSESPNVLVVGCDPLSFGGGGSEFRAIRLEPGSEISVDLQKTNSIMNPYVGIVRIHGRIQSNSSNCFVSAEEARQHVAPNEWSGNDLIFDMEAYYGTDSGDLVLSGGNEYFQNAFMTYARSAHLEPNDPWQRVFRFPAK